MGRSPTDLPGRLPPRRPLADARRRHRFLTDYLTARRPTPLASRRQPARRHQADREIAEGRLPFPNASEEWSPNGDDRGSCPKPQLGEKKIKPLTRGTWANAPRAYAPARTSPQGGRTRRRRLCALQLPLEAERCFTFTRLSGELPRLPVAVSPQASASSRRSKRASVPSTSGIPVDAGCASGRIRISDPRIRRSLSGRPAGSAACWRRALVSCSR